MSYFSHHPEAWDEIERKGVADMFGHDLEDEDHDVFMETLIEWQSANPQKWQSLTDKAQRQIAAREQDYWGDMADAAIGRAEAVRDV